MKCAIIVIVIFFSLFDMKIFHCTWKFRNKNDLQIKIGCISYKRYIKCKHFLCYICPKAPNCKKCDIKKYSTKRQKKIWDVIYKKKCIFKKISFKLASMLIISLSRINKVVFIYRHLFYLSKKLHTFTVLLVMIYPV